MGLLLPDLKFSWGESLPFGIYCVYVCVFSLLPTLLKLWQVRSWTCGTTDLHRAETCHTDPFRQALSLPTGLSCSQYQSYTLH